MFTFQDFEKEKNAHGVIAAVRLAIEKHKNTQMYKIAKDAEEYAKHKNVTISKFQKFLRDEVGKVIPDNFSPNYKIASRFFDIFITQEVQFLLGNGINWNNNEKAEKLLGKDFDTKIQDAGREALIGAASYCFFNNDHIEVFKYTEYMSLPDEITGTAMAGVRFWQIDDNKPISVILFEIDGYTQIELNIGEETQDVIKQQKRAYKLVISETQAEGQWISGTENYSALPVVPLWGNKNHQSELVGLREAIDCYDLIKSGFASDVDEVNLIYWIIENASGMSDMDIKKFLSQLKTLHGASLPDDARVHEHQAEVPFQSREALLDRLKSDLYTDAMAVDVSIIAAGSVTATQIRAAYNSLMLKVNGFEYCVTQCIDQIAKIAGLDDVPTYEREIIINETEKLQFLLQAATILPKRYVIAKMLTLMGDKDKVEEILQMIDDEQSQALVQMQQVQQIQEGGGIALEEEEEEEE